MPWRSNQQREWGHSAEGEAALGGPSAVAEWDAATKGKRLPKRVTPKKPKKAKKKGR